MGEECIRRLVRKSKWCGQLKKIKREFEEKKNSENFYEESG